MKFGNWKLEIRNLLFIVLLFLILPFLNPTIASAINSETSSDILPTITQIPTPPTTQTSNSEPSLLERFFDWFLGLFSKTDYTINPSRPSDEKIRDMTNYGDKQDPNNKEKHSFAGSRLTDSNSQNCLKGNVIKKVILNIDTNNSDLSNICFDSVNKCIVEPLNNPDPNLTGCVKKNIKDLAHYFVQKQQQFYCDPNNKSVEIGQDIIDNVNQLFTTPISDVELICYQQIYDDFYLTPKDASKKDENTKKMMQTPISASSQDSTDDTDAITTKLNKNFSPDGTNGGLSGLRPENDK